MRDSLVTLFIALMLTAETVGRKIRPPGNGTLTGDSIPTIPPKPEFKFMESVTPSNESLLYASNLRTFTNIFDIIAADACYVTHWIDDDVTVLVASDYEKFKYSCQQTFRPVNPTSKLALVCSSVSIRFSCRLESLTITVDGKSEKFCVTDDVPDFEGFEIELEYHRHAYGFNGGYICFITAVSQQPEGGINDPKCSDVALSTDERIVGGVIAVKNEFPWMALVIIHIGSSYYVCGGVLISSQFVLTAAHCLYAAHDKITVELGKLDMSISNEAGSVKQDGINYEIHHSYDPNTVVNDIALILINPVTYSKSIKPACLPASDIVLDGRKVLAIGWGHTTYGGSLADILQKVLLDVVANAQCSLTWSNLISSQFCTFTVGKDSCSGDSGGPLILEDNGTFIVIGLTSYGFECASQYAAVNTRLSKMLQWIYDTIHGLLP